MSIIELVIEEEVTELVFEQGFEGPPGGGSSVPADSLVITTGQLLPLDKRYIYFTPPAGVLGNYSAFDGDQTACELHGGYYNTDDDTCTDSGLGFFSNGAALTLKLDEDCTPNHIYTLVNGNPSQQFFVALDPLSYPEHIFEVPASGTLEIQLVSGTWRKVIDTSEDTGGLELGTTSTTAGRGDHTATALAHAQTTHDKAFVGLGNVANLSPADYPVSNATQSELDTKADLAGADFTGPVTAPSLDVAGEIVGDSVQADTAQINTISQVSILSNTQSPYTPTGSTVTLALNTQQHVELLLTSGSGPLTATLTPPAGSGVLTFGTILIWQHATTARDLDFVSSSTVNWNTPEPNWTALPIGQPIVISYLYAASQWFLSAGKQLVIGTTTGTAFDGALGAAKADKANVLHVGIPNEWSDLVDAASNSGSYVDGDDMTQDTGGFTINAKDSSTQKPDATFNVSVMDGAYFEQSIYRIGAGETGYIISQPAGFRSTLGLGTMATENAASYLPLVGGTLTGPLIGLGNALQIRSGTTAQRVEVYGTFTDASNYVRAALTSNGTSSITLAAERAGGVTNVDIVLTPSGTGRVIGDNGFLVPCLVTGETAKRLQMRSNTGGAFTEPIFYLGVAGFESSGLAFRSNGTLQFTSGIACGSGADFLVGFSNGYGIRRGAAGNGLFLLTEGGLSNQRYTFNSGSNTNASSVWQAQTSTTAGTGLALEERTWADSAHASRKGRIVYSVADTAAREYMRAEASGSAPMLGFLGASAIVRPTTGIAAATFAANTSGIANDTATFDGYTIGQIAKALRDFGLLT